MAVSDALAYLAAVPPTLLPGEYLEVRAVHPLAGAKRAYCTTLPQTAAQALAWSEGGAQTWVAINPRAGRRSGDQAVPRSQALAGDVDVKLFAGDVGAMHEAVEAFPLRPSLVVSSGSGLQVYWLLAAPVTLAETGRRMREIAYRLARALCGPERRPDEIGNPERLLRLPGTLNHKYRPARRVELLWDEPQRYQLEELEHWLAEHAPWTAPEPARAPAPPGPASEAIRDFNRRFDVVDLLLRHGATLVSRHGAVLHFRRPGKSEGVSATLGHYPGVLHMFSSKWPPFEQGHGYDAFEVYSLLAYGGDRRAAYHAAVELGYGMRFGLRVDSSPACLAVRGLAGGYG